MSHTRKVPFLVWRKKRWSDDALCWVVVALVLTSFCQPFKACAGFSMRSHRFWIKSAPGESICCHCGSLATMFLCCCVFGLKILLSLILCTELMLFTVCSSRPISVHVAQFSHCVSEKVPSGYSAALAPLLIDGDALFCQLTEDCSRLLD